ncbi:hypothetical protein [Fontivita pretiosa]|uniref:hypothetical protein n=1 Tax=Fontivita pretiosa TaxID=2989684 RepID=UPI003D17E6A5
MASTTQPAATARGIISEVRDSIVVFEPSGTNYRLHLKVADNPGRRPVASERPVRGIIRVQARKLWTVPSGGNFIVPIFGPPRTIQGRVKAVEQGTLVVHAGTTFVVEMPKEDWAIDLTHGPIQVGAIVNVAALPGATFELAGSVPGSGN